MLGKSIRHDLTDSAGGRALMLHVTRLTSGLASIRSNR